MNPPEDLGDWFAEWLLTNVSRPGDTEELWRVNADEILAELADNPEAVSWLTDAATSPNALRAAFIAGIAWITDPNRLIGRSAGAEAASRYP